MKPYMLLLIAFVIRVNPSASESLRPSFFSKDTAKGARRLTQISFETVGKDHKPTSAFPLGKCQGDCDHDNDCKDDLKCFQRKDGDTTLIPGCAGETDKGIDYCFDAEDPYGRPSPKPTRKPTRKPTFKPTRKPTRKSTSRLKRVGNNNKPESIYPLDKCEGDCDGDDDCKDNLKCFLRKDGDANPIPGCAGEPFKGTDYCFDEEDPNIKPISKPTRKPTQRPMPTSTREPSIRPISMPPTPKPTPTKPTLDTRSPTSKPTTKPEGLFGGPDGSSSPPNGQPTDLPKKSPREDPIVCDVDSLGNYGDIDTNVVVVSYFYQMVTKVGVSEADMVNQILPKVDFGVGSSLLPLVFPDKCAETTLRRLSKGGMQEAELVGLSSRPIEMVLSGVPCISNIKNCFFVLGGITLFTKRETPEALSLAIRVEIERLIDEGAYNDLDSRIVSMSSAGKPPLGGNLDDGADGNGDDIPIWAWVFVGAGGCLVILSGLIAVRWNRQRESQAEATNLKEEVVYQYQNMPNDTIISDEDGVSEDGNQGEPPPRISRSSIPVVEEHGEEEDQVQMPEEIFF